MRIAKQSWRRGTLSPPVSTGAVAAIVALLLAVVAAAAMMLTFTLLPLVEM